MTYEELKVVIQNNTEASWQENNIVEALESYVDRIVEQLEEKKTKFSFPKHCKSIGVCPPEKTCSECIVEKFVEDIIAIMKGVQNE